MDEIILKLAEVQKTVDDYGQGATEAIQEYNDRVDKLKAFQQTADDIVSTIEDLNRALADFKSDCDEVGDWIDQVS